MRVRFSRIHSYDERKELGQSHGRDSAKKFVVRPSGGSLYIHRTDLVTPTNFRLKAGLQTFTQSRQWVGFALSL